MQFEHSIFLAAGLLAFVGLVWLYRRLRQSHRDLLQRFASPHLVEKLTSSVSPKKRNLKFVFLLVAVACVFVALSRPQAGFRWEEAHRKGIDILMAVDTSRSMLANDVQPNRLERSKLGILDFVSKLEGDRVGLIPFSGTAFLMCPLTLDYDAFRQSLNAIDTTIMPRGGTDVASAIREAEAAFDKDANHRILVLITDGEDLEGEGLAAAKAAAKRGITIHTVGVGTPAGELIPLGAAGAGFVKDEQGQVVKSRLDEAMLREMAEVTGGSYEPLGRQAEGLEAIYHEKLSLVPKEEFAQRMRRVPIERFEWPLLLALVLLCLEYGLTDRKVIRRSPRAVVTTAGRRLLKKRKLVAAAAVGGLLAASLPVDARASTRDAEAAYEQGEYAAASAEYNDALARSPDNPKLWFNAGASAYKNDDFAGAAGAFESVLADEDLSLQSQAYYNLGNTQYRQGQSTEQSDPQQTIQQWQQALTSYEGTLALNSEDEDAKFNHDLVKRRLEELQKQQEQQQQQECENPEQQSGSDENEEEQDGDPQGSGTQENEENQDNQDNQNDEQQSAESESESDEESEPNQDQASSDGSSEEEEEGEPDSGQGSLPDTASDQSGQDEQADEGSEEEEQQQTDASPGSEDEQQGRPQASQGQPQPSQGQPEGQPSGSGSRTNPGEMTPEEAASLLDSLKGEDGDTPFVPTPNAFAGGQSDDPRRDW